MLIFVDAFFFFNHRYHFEVNAQASEGSKKRKYSKDRNESIEEMPLIWSGHTQCYPPYSDKIINEIHLR